MRLQTVCTGPLAGKCLPCACPFVGQELQFALLQATYKATTKTNAATPPLKDAERRVPALVTEADPSDSPIGEAEVSNAVVRLSLAVEKATELLEAAQLLHTRLADLAALTLRVHSRTR
jgi:hypothetical protein